MFKSVCQNKLHHSLLSWDINFSRILQLDWPTFWHKTWEPEFCQICNQWWNIKRNISFLFRLFQEKLMTKFLKNLKKPILGPFWGSFWPLLPKFKKKKRLLLRKRALAVFTYYSYLIPCKKQKKLMTHSREKWQTDERADRQWWFYRTICKTGVHKSWK